ncbi:hypothetical protein CHLRE_14g618820v5 [Chlamydomonas reinhardtii]|uniref:Cas12f1-like TNB domain-containing protein n=1 Tax=Chlamydomonas reinhardtii TaxID=3055 RepID=A0A2K3CXU1_CHLRE|nr:uncharacterized protein CHLRE_14g618820v5 [Chlamydomonas reinhardtii]PNW73101.1 hypothetical protein CHLRE_14g618820v5 [Chlamydomonas reinhardtii]
MCDLTEQGRKRGWPSKRDQHPEDDLFRHVCEEHFPRDEEAAGARVNRSGLTPFLPPLSKGMFTNVNNHYGANFAAWLARSFRCRIDDELRELRTPATEKLDKLAWSMAHAVLYDGELEQPRWWVGWAQGAAAQAAGGAAAAAAQGAGPAGGAAAAQAAGAAAAAAAQGAGPAGGAAAAQAWTALVDYVNAQRASKRAAELLLREVKGAQATYKKASTRHMEWAAEILAGLEARRDQLGAQVQQLTQAQPLTREDTQRLASLRRELHRARPFTLTPSPSFAPIYVPLDNTSMARLPGLLPTLARRHGEVFAGAGAGAVAPSSFVQAAFGGGGMQSSATLNAVGWGLFQLGGVTSRNAPFANYITTDGVACSVAREAHNKPLANLKPATAPADAEELCTLEEMKATQIIGVDPCGGGNWFMAARSPLYQPGPWAWEGVREGVSPAQRSLLELHDKQLDEELFPGQLPPEPRRRRKGVRREGGGRKGGGRKGGHRRKQSKHWQPRAYIGGIPMAATASAARFEERLRYLFASGAAGQAAGQEAGQAAGQAEAAGQAAGQAEAAGPAEAGPRGAVHVLWHYHFSAFRRKRWAAFIQRDRALHRVAKQLTGGRPKEQVVVGWGSWAFQGGKGGSPISVRGGRALTGRLIKLLRERYAKHVFIVDEYKTSKTCYNCGCQEMAIKRLGGLKEGQRPWSVKVCNDCLTTWNRDVSAANVIRAWAPPAEADGLRAADQAAAAAMAAGNGGAGLRA